MSQKIFAWLFLLTGIFALAGSLFTWGEGYLFAQQDINMKLLPLADLIMTAPLSILTAIALWQNKKEGITFGLVTSGIYLFGTLLVYIKLFAHGSNLPAYLAIPPVFGVSIAVAFIYFSNQQIKK